MKDRRRRDLSVCNRFCRCSRFVLIFSALLFALAFSTFRLIGVSFRPVLLPSGRNAGSKAVVNEFYNKRGTSLARRIFRQHTGLHIEDAIAFPDRILVILKLPFNSSLWTDDEFQCLFYTSTSSDPGVVLPAASVDGDNHQIKILKCPLLGTSYSRVSVLHNVLPVELRRDWQSLAYNAFIDTDNTTVVFVKGLNLRAERLANASRFECVYGANFERGRFLRSNALSVAQEVVRCPTPLVLLKQVSSLSSTKVSVNFKGRGIIKSIAWPELLSHPRDPQQKHRMCVCTMLRNQARFLREWVIYHARVGVERWFVYDNNSDDAIEDAVDSLGRLGYEISRHVWPWIKTQEAGFAHCAMRAREVCEWVGFIDVDEFLYFPSNNHTLQSILASYADQPVGEIRSSCFSFGPSGLKRPPKQGVTAGYTCRLAAPERHKSIVRPEAINSTLLNVVHHFHLAQPYQHVNIDRSVMVINHYKYQVWEVFKEKFYRRVATYVSDWQENENGGSKDRAPGLGTQAIEPTDWSSRFCEVSDTGLRSWVLQEFMDHATSQLPWELSSQ